MILQNQKRIYVSQICSLHGTFISLMHSKMSKSRFIQNIPFVFQVTNKSTILDKWIRLSLILFIISWYVFPNRETSYGLQNVNSNVVSGCHSSVLTKPSGCILAGEASWMNSRNGFIVIQIWSNDAIQIGVVVARKKI